MIILDKPGYAGPEPSGQAALHGTPLSHCSPDAIERGAAWARLMGLAQTGDANAYRKLLVEIAPYLRKLAGRHHRDPRDVEDSVQDILLTLHSIRHTYDPVRPFKPWLVAIARRRIIDRLRVQGRQKARETGLETVHETFASDETKLWDFWESGPLVHDAIGRLPPGQRAAITMVKIREMPLKDAAAASGVSVASLKVSTHRAVKNLRKILKAGAL